jgi:hypothetical protein
MYVKNLAGLCSSNNAIYLGHSEQHMYVKNLAGLCSSNNAIYTSTRRYYLIDDPSLDNLPSLQGPNTAAQPYLRDKAVGSTRSSADLLFPLLSRLCYCRGSLAVVSLLLSRPYCCRGYIGGLCNHEDQSSTPHSRSSFLFRMRVAVSVITTHLLIANEPQEHPTDICIM